MQLSFDLSVHKNENNPISQAYLDAHKEQFAADTFKVLCAYVNGRRLNYKVALNEGLTGDLRRRTKDLRDYGIPVSDEWIATTNERRYKEYFMTEQDKVAALKILLSKVKEAA